MFLKKLFGKSKNCEAEPQLNTQDSMKSVPHGHPGNIDQKDKEKCPFFNKNKQISGGKDKKDKKKKEEDQPKGGCPFMNSSDDQKNPGLQIYDQAYDEQYVSKFKYYLSKAKIDLDFFQSKGKRKNRCRDIFDTYPIYLQHTLFYNTEDLQKIRTFECCSRFMAYEELREKGNKKFNKGKYGRALDYYERAFSLYKWLEFKEADDAPSVATSQTDINFKTETQLSESISSESKIEFNLQEENPQEKQKRNKQKDEIRTKYKEFFVFYCDQNTQLKDGQEMTQTPDIDMRKSLLVQIFLNMAAAYMKLNHFKVALQCCQDAQKLSNKVSQTYLRKAQALVLNKSATIQQIQSAKQAIQTAIQNKTTEKIFSNTNKNILKMLNLHDADEAYEKCLLLVNQRLNQTRESVQTRVIAVYERAKEIHSIQQQIISKGRQPTQRILQKTAMESSQFQIILRMKEKYLRVIDFYTQSNKKDQVTAAKSQLQEVLRVIHTMKVINEITVDKFPAEGELGDRQSEKIKRRIEKIKTDQSEDQYNKGKYNFEVLQWAIKEIVEEEFKAKQLEKKKKQQEQAMLLGTNVNVKEANHAKYLWLLVLLPILAILISRLFI